LNWNLFNFPPLFWVFTLGMALLALVFVLPPLLRSRPASSLLQRRQVNIDVYRDQLRDLETEYAQGAFDKEQFDAAKLELENRLAQDALSEEDQPVFNKGGKKLGIALGVAIPLLAFGTYFLIGNPWAITEAAAQQPMAAAGGHGDFSAMLEKAIKKTEDNPNDAEAWVMLAKTHSVMEQWPEANKAYTRAVALQPKNATALAGQAEALAILNGRVMQGKPTELVLQALAINPQEPKALELAGIGAFQEDNFAQAAYYWKQLLNQLPPDSPYAMDIAMAMKEAKERAETAFGKPLDKMLGTDKVVIQTINGTVDINPALKGKVPANAAIFLFAKPLDGRMPVAAIRSEAAKLPLEFELNDTMAMNPEARLSSFKEVVLTARISMSGEAMAKSGDLEGTLTPVKVGAKDIRLVIDTVRP
jgi:cytochrome c-type biogenesis protein CcmH